MIYLNGAKAVTQHYVNLLILLSLCCFIVWKITEHLMMKANTGNASEHIESIISVLITYCKKRLNLVHYYCQLYLRYL